MKTIEQLIKEIEEANVFIFKDGEYLCTGYSLGITEAYVEIHKQLKCLRDVKNINKL